MLAYVFWHRPRDPDGAAAYEQAHLAFHRSLDRRRPVGMCASAVFRSDAVAWLAPAADVAPAPAAASAGTYEDWYLLEDFTALGVLNEAAVGRGHRTSHDDVARRYGAGTGSLYCLLEGDRGELARDPGGLARMSHATWVSRPAGTHSRSLGELLADGVDPLDASLWRRQLVLGPAPEYCLLTGGGEAPAGVASSRLPAGWSAQTIEREVLWHG